MEPRSLQTLKGKEGSKATLRAHYVDNTADSRTPSPDPDFPIFYIHTMRDNAEHSTKVDVQVNGVPLIMELDTGAAYPIVSKDSWKSLLPNVKLENIDLPLATYTGEWLNMLGHMCVQVQHEDQESRLPPLIVVDCKESPLFGRK